MIDKQFILISNGDMFQSDNIAEIITMIAHGEKFVVVDRSNMNTITNLNDLYASKDAEENHIPRSYENLTPGQKKKILAQIAEINEYVDNWKEKRNNADMDLTPKQKQILEEAQKEGLVEYNGRYTNVFWDKTDDIFWDLSFYRIKKKEDS